MKGKISEVFTSIQGEGLYLGEEQLFLRFFGCNLSCGFCDTPLDYFKEYEPQELFEEIILYHHNFHSISFTGGEPLLQKDFLKEILMLTRCAGYKNYLETNGTLSGELEEVIGYVDIVAMDVKLPSSTDRHKLWGLHRRFLKIAGQKEVFVKTVICQSTTEEDLKQACNLISEVNRSAILILQPNGYENYSELSAKLESFRDLSTREGIITCVIPQMHKIVGIK